MSSYNRFSIIIGSIFLAILMTSGCSSPEPQWPEITQENKPWTRWWWQGSAVDKQNLTRSLEEYHDAGLGGVEITPIYGVAGYEDQFLDYLSPRWMEMLDHTLSEGQRLDIGIDMATGTGWPFGGPWIHGEHASKRLYYKTYELSGGETLDETINLTQEPYVRAVGNHVYELHGFLKAEGEEPQGTVDDPLEKEGSEPLTIEDVEQPISANENLQRLALEQVRFEEDLPLQALMAYSDDGQVFDLTDQVQANGSLDWTAPDGEWSLYAVFTGWHGKMVERAAPGGEGLVIDHFSEPALDHYLATFDSAFAGDDLSNLRSFFNDSYEVDDAEGQANWTPAVFEEFEKRRGYDLRDHLPALLNEDSEEHPRVLTDYRETISDLLLEKFTQKWDEWAEDNGALIRNQAHGSPANILDLYAASDIPETEGTDILRAKMASSAANVTGKQLTSAESATWLNEHFLSNLANVKTAIDRYFVSGVNHIFYHGTAYSPEGDEWPGWLFYAAVHFNERNPLWDHFGTFNHYVARVQSFLQSGTPDNDLLLYFPIHDQWAESGSEMLRHFDGGLDAGFDGSGFKQGAEQMVEEGYGFDFISDKQVLEVQQDGSELQTGETSYQTIVVPQSRYIPVATFEKLIDLARNGATILAYQGLPEGVPGLGNLEERQSQFKSLVDELAFSEVSGQNIQEATVGEGRILRGENLNGLLTYSGIEREAMVDQGLQFNRRKHESGHTYFITNWADEKVDGWVPLARDVESATIFDPMQDELGYARVRTSQDGGSEIYLQADPGESFILETNASESREATYRYVEPTGDEVPVNGTWTLEFTEGGPELPGEIETDTLGSWTGFPGDEVKRFSGKGEYSITFDRPQSDAEGWLLDLGEVHESATVSINGEEVAKLIGPTFQVYVDNALLEDTNTLEVEIANLMANRISWMEKQEVNWKKFYNVNFPARLGENRNERGLFDASDWEPLPSGLVGPVKMVPVNRMQ
ncbi:hypothetical protein NC796_25700 [Aliifodinibius sp. S!AR15-10]|uniref:glycosyl hydrolase n=1 Tax=Aliifodinibius sp. S!AR15-10 TaxID=2950437 RepID=UPI00285A64EC|nr:glycosyl hydrolase [Aliifodinibius sp. S!AR15-10]MDR8394566.1 hypothetical protein [Aliifodinibius sp. S!AR15-10]